MGRLSHRELVMQQKRGTVVRSRFAKFWKFKKFLARCAREEDSLLRDIRREQKAASRPP